MTGIVIVHSENAATERPPHMSLPRRIFSAWSAKHNGTITHAPPASLDELAHAHNRTYIAQMLAGRRKNGYGGQSLAIARCVPHIAGVVLAAAHHAWNTGGIAAATVQGGSMAGLMSATCGQHVNALIVAARAIQHAHIGARVGILDYAFHAATGTREIIERQRYGNILHVSAGVEYGYCADEHAFLRAINAHVAQMRQCDIVLYQAGADQHRADPFGGFLSDNGYTARDDAVFAGLHDMPLVLCPGGGGQAVDDIVALHMGTFASATRHAGSSK